MRAFVFAAVAALTAAQVTNQCRSCDGRPNCCAAEAMIWDVEGSTFCYEQATGDICDLCNTCAANTKPLETIQVHTGVAEGGNEGNGGGFGFAILEDGMDGFLNIRGSTFTKFPDFMKGIGGILFDRDVGPSWAPTFQCSMPPCDHYIFAYRGCRSCVSANIHTLHELLSESGWVKNSCGPVFSHTPEGHQHKFTVYHLETAAETTLVAPGVALDFVWVATAPKAKLCSEEYDECACNRRAECSYDRNTGTCRTFWCKKPSEDVCAKNKDGSLNFDNTPREFCEVLPTRPAATKKPTPAPTPVPKPTPVPTKKPTPAPTPAPTYATRAPSVYSSPPTPQPTPAPTYATRAPSVYGPTA